MPIKSNTRPIRKFSNIFPQGGRSYQAKPYQPRNDMNRDMNIMSKPDVLEWSKDFRTVNPHQVKVKDGIIWNGGNSIEWAVAKARFVQEFQRYGIPADFYDLNFPMGEADEESGIFPPGPDKFVEEEPAYVAYVTNKVQEREQDNNEARLERLALLEGDEFIGNAERARE